MRYDPVDPQFFVRNRARLCEKLKPNSLVIIHANDIMPSNADGVLPFHQNRDLYHLTGIDQEETIIFLCPDALEPKDREILFTREPSEHLAIWEGHKLTKDQAIGISGMENVQWTSTFETTLHRIAPQIDHIYLHTNEHLRADTIVETRNSRFIQMCQDRYPLHRYERVAPLMHELRMIKDPEEVRFLQKAIDITEAGFKRVLGFIKPGVGEWEIEAEYLHEFVRRKSKGFAYPPIVGSGKNALVLHYVENDQVCEDGEMVLMDVAAEYGNWNADMTRTVPVSGKFTDRQRDVYNAVLRVLRACEKILRPGILIRDYQKKVIEIMEGELIGLGLIDAEEAKQQGEDKALVKKYFMHGTSHHLGLDVHDVAPPKQEVQVGMVFTIEPGIYIPEENMGIRLENDYVIGEDENIDLFGNIPIEVEEIEALMK